MRQIFVSVLFFYHYSKTKNIKNTIYILTSFLLMFLLKLVYVVVEVFLFSCVISWVKFNFRLLVIRKNHCKLVNVLAEDAASQASGSS